MRVILAMVLLALTGPVSAVERAPAGTYLLYEGLKVPPETVDCARIIERTGATEEMARTLLLGSLPQGHPAVGASYLIMTGDRMESTSLAEGDVESGALRFEGSEGRGTAFTLFPDSDPELRLEGTIEIEADGVVSTISIRGIPIDDRGGTVDRLTHYCKIAAGIPV